MEDKGYYIYVSKNDHKKVFIIAWEQGAKLLYPVAKQLNEQGYTLDAILGFSHAENVEMESEYAAISSGLYVFTLDGSYGAKTDVQGAIADILSYEDKPGAMYIACPEEMKRSIDKRIKSKFSHELFSFPV